METIEIKDSKMITTIHQASELSSSFLVTSNEIAGDVLLVLIIESVDESTDVDSTSVLEIPDGVIGSSAMMGPPVEGGRLGSKDGESDTADVVSVVSGRLVEVVSERLVVKRPEGLGSKVGESVPVELELVSGRLVARRPAMGEGLGSKVGEPDSADIPAEVEVVSGTLVVTLDSLVVSSGIVLPVEDPVVSASLVVSSDGRRQTGALESSNNVHTPPFVQSFSQLFPS